MKNNSTTWLIVMVLGAAFLGARWMMSDHGFGKSYVKVSQETRYRIPSDSEKVYPTDAPIDKWMNAADAKNADVDVASLPPTSQKVLTTTDAATFVDYWKAEQANPNQTDIVFSMSRTLGVWFAALMTLFVMTFLVGDNPMYKIAESIFIGVSAAYWMVVGFWSTLVPNLFAKIWPGVIRNWAMPGLSSYETHEWVYLVPLILGIMLLWRLSPKGGWISRWPMAFIIGVFCGLRLITFLAADFVSQIRSGIVSLYVPEATGMDTVWASLRNIFLVAGVLTCLVYFFFSIEHKGIVGKTARVGIWFLMITFGAAFGYTVMGRIALLAIRFEFIFDDWLWLIDPSLKHTVVAGTSMILPIMTKGLALLALL